MKNKSETPTNLIENNINLNSNNSSPTPMLTRSRAQAASSPSNSIITLSKNSSTRHYGGRIVKPIAVRASPSSSSSITSTHNSSNTLKISNNIKSKLKTLQSENNTNNDSFSLIAKYFASFPATRLKPFQIPNKTFKTNGNNYIKNDDLNQLNNNNNDLCNNFKKLININDDFNKQDSSNNTNQNNNNNRLGQITMETRLTRKFLIKHHFHPYFSSIDSDISTSNQQQQQQRVLRKRPSINFIKMKKNLVNNSSKSPNLSPYRTRSPSPITFTPPIITDELDLVLNDSSFNSKLSINDDKDSGYQSLNRYSTNNNKCTSSKCCKLFSFSSAASSCTCDLDLDQIEND